MRGTDLYETDFDSFSTGNDQLVGTDGWTGTNIGEGVHGIDDGLVTGLGKTAFLGFNRPSTSFVSVSRAVDYDPIAAGTPDVEFFALIGIADSTNGEYDRFYITFYNQSDDLLAAIAFDNTPANFGLMRFDGKDLIHTGELFVNDAVQALFVSVNYPENTWSAKLDGLPLFTDAPFNTTGAGMNLGSIAAEWELTRAGQPGDNWMLIDEWTVTAKGDNRPPVISGLPPDLSVSTDPGSSTAVVSWQEPTATDNVAVTGFVSSHSNASAFPPGVTTVTYTARDAANNTATASFSITVTDTEKPEITGVPEEILLTASPGEVPVAITWTPPTATDNVAVTAFTSNGNPGDAFPEGETIITYLARDSAGNEQSASFRIVITLSNPPEQAYLAWQHAYFGDSEYDGLADPDQDGLANLLEFGIGTHPLRAAGDDGFTAAPRLIPLTAGTEITAVAFQFQIPTSIAPEVILEVLQSSSLQQEDWLVTATRQGDAPWSGPAVDAGRLETTALDANSSLIKVNEGDLAALSLQYFSLRVRLAP